MPMMYAFFAYQTIKQSEGDMVTPMLMLVFSVVLNIALDPLFIITFGWGVNGAAIATTIARLLALVPIVFVIALDKKGLATNSFKYLRPNRKTIKEILKIGMPSGIGRVTSALGFMVMNGFIYSYGSSVMTAFVIGNRITSLIMMPAMGIGSATTTIIGQNIGAGNIKRAKDALKKTLIIALGFSFVGVILLMFFKAQMIGVFTKTESVTESAINYTNMVVMALPLMAIFQAMSGFFIGTKHTMMSMTGDLVRLWGLRIPLILIFKFVFKMDEYAIWWPMLISNFLADTLYMLMYLGKRWQKPIKD
jgi:putative MATE family efflux protein